MLEDFKVRRSQAHSGKSCRHYRKAVKIIRDGLSGSETAEQIQTTQVLRLGEQPDHRLQTAKQKLPTRCAFAISLTDLFDG
jgi:hypothetical protein